MNLCLKSFSIYLSKNNQLSWVSEWRQHPRGLSQDFNCASSIINMNYNTIYREWNIANFDIKWILINNIIHLKFKYKLCSLILGLPSIKVVQHTISLSLSLESCTTTNFFLTLFVTLLLSIYCLFHYYRRNRSCGDRCCNSYSVRVLNFVFLKLKPIV